MSSFVKILPFSQAGELPIIAHLWVYTSSDFLSHHLKSEEVIRLTEGEDPPSVVPFFDGHQHHFLCRINPDNTPECKEKIRKTGAEVLGQLTQRTLMNVHVHHHINNDLLWDFMEGLVLSGYRFDKYKKTKHASDLCLFMEDAWVNDTWLPLLKGLVEGVCKARDLVNEPNSYLTAVTLGEEIALMGKQAGFEVDVWSESKIQSQKMGGLLAVNKGSTVPPTFTFMEYRHPEWDSIQPPVVLVGKGIVYDTGGMSLKPTPSSMDYMKCDMAGAATVAGVMYAIASAGLNIHVIGLIPATDNRPGEEAYVPGDVIEMMSGHTVEVKNTDAEGRLVLADALFYARKFSPSLVIDVATLTGAAVRAIGPYASAIMGTASEHLLQSFSDSGRQTNEKMITFPLWEEYGEELKSEVADFSNLGKSEGGHISAGMFLKKFTDYPWIHMDIAGTAFVHQKKDYLTYGGTGVGIRSLFHFLRRNFAS